MFSEPRPGRPTRIDEEAASTATLTPPPKKYGLTHGTSRLLAEHLMSARPLCPGSKVTDVVGMYLAPPENAIVVCVGEKKQIRALDRTVPMLPMRTGSIEKHSHDYKRPATTALFAALGIATGHVTGAVKPKHPRFHVRFTLRSE